MRYFWRKPLLHLGKMIRSYWSSRSYARDDDCAHDDENPVCGQCFIGKCVHAMPEKRCRPVFITTVHYIAEKIIEAIHAHPNKEVVFLITACELTLEMFGDWGNSITIRGIGVRLDGQICNTMKAFEASERGIKPGLAVVLAENTAAHAGCHCCPKASRNSQLRTTRPVYSNRPERPSWKLPQKIVNTIKGQQGLSPKISPALNECRKNGAVSYGTAPEQQHPNLIL
jgi:hypothetical protein